MDAIFLYNKNEEFYSKKVHSFKKSKKNVITESEITKEKVINLGLS